MNAARAAFLDRVRQAVAAGNRSGAARAIEPRGAVGYQGAGPDAAACFAEALVAAGGFAHLVPDARAATAQILELVQAKGARRILLGRKPRLDSLDLQERLRAAGYEVVVVDSLSGASSKDPLFAADLGISGVDYLIAETGSVVLMARPSEPRSLSLLPPVHIAVADRSQLLPDLFDLFELALRGGSESPSPPYSGEKGWGEGAEASAASPPHPQPLSPEYRGEGRHFEQTLARGSSEMPSYLGLITGPSKTGDIELRLVTGVHGPREIHVVLINA